MTMSDRIAVSSHGRLEQVAPPLEVYHRPCTRFVGVHRRQQHLRRHHGRVAAGMRDARYPGTGPGRRDAWQRAGQGAVDVLIRPERVQLAGHGADRTLPNQLVMEIGVIVNYGDSVLVIGSVNGQRLRMRIAGAQPESVCEGATVTVGWKPGDEHLIPR